jgi:6-phosphogluconolactonase
LARAPGQRAYESIRPAVLFSQSAAGKLIYLSSTPTEKQPRGFRLDPKGLRMVVSGEKSDTISVHEIDPVSGQLKFLQDYPTSKGSNWVEIASFG